MKKAKPMTEREEGIISGFKWSGVTAIVCGIIFKKADVFVVGCSQILAAYGVELKEKIDYAYDKKVETEKIESIETSSAVE